MNVYFLMCSERSGSNFITKLLNGHEEICGPSPKHIINPVARNIFRYGDLNVENNWHDLISDLSNMINVDFSIWNTKFDEQKLRNIAPKGDVKSLLYNIFYEETHSNNKKHVFIKENLLYEFLPFLMLIFPDAKYIYQVRDPRDMALSWKNNENMPGGIVKASQQWKLDQQNFLKSHWVLSQTQQSFMIKYEDLISDTTNQLQKITEFLNVKYSSNMLRFHEDELTRRNSQRNSAWENLSKDVLKNNKNKYLTGLSKKEIKIIEKICFYEMLHLGYKPINKTNEIENITREEIEEHYSYEQKSVKFNQIDGVKDNIKAKKRFYERFCNNGT